jgi:AraC-like DNA-binding protein
MPATSPRVSSARVAVAETADAAGRVSTRASARPDPRLEGIVTRAPVGVVREAGEAARWLAAAVPAFTMIVTLREPVRMQGGELPGDWLGGMNDAYDVVEIPARHGSLDFKLSPLGAFTVLGSPLSQLDGGFASLDDLFGADGRRLGDAVREASDWLERFDRVEAFLLRRVADGPRPTPVVAHAWSLLSRADGRIRIAELAAAVGASRRYLTVKFREEVGLAPKAVARVLRFADARRRIAAEPARFADIALACGYCDQAHLNRDFRELGGTTPGEFLKVTFLQDRTPAGA